MKTEICRLKSGEKKNRNQKISKIKEKKEGIGKEVGAWEWGEKKRRGKRRE